MLIPAIPLINDTGFGKAGGFLIVNMESIYSKG